MSIKILPDNIVNQIAAGEVIERPSSIVKELVENSIDAQADIISIEIEDGGIEKIKITDNGIGIPRDELALAVTRHATSKITSIEDLEKIGSLGFRGEALASIASVSKVSIQSRQEADEFGHELMVEFGTVGEPVKKGANKGTIIVISELFKELPARKKFLKTAATEAKYISEIVTSFALSYPKISFTYKKNGKESFQVQKVNSITERIRQIWGNDLFIDLSEMFYEHPHLIIKGFAGKPELSGRKAEQWMFVNNRWINDRTIHAAVRDAYGGLLPPKGRPFFVIYIETPPHMVDVNVHPRKEEVRFASQSFVYSSLKTAIREALNKTVMTPRVRNVSWDDNEKIKDRIEKSDWEGLNQISKFKYQKSNGRQSGLGDTRAGSRNDYQQQPTQYDFVHDRSSQSLPWENESNLHNDKPFQIFDNVYIFEFGDTVTVYDQHALHERVLYERFKKSFESSIAQPEIQSLLIPQSVTLSPKEWETYQEAKDIFTNLGFDIEEKENRVLQIIAIPVSLKNSRIRDLIPTVLDEWGQHENITADKDLALSYMACRSAVKAGDVLTQEEVRALLSQLDEVDKLYTCPHGRPFKVELNRKELDKWFKRSGFG